MDNISSVLTRLKELTNIYKGEVNELISSIKSMLQKECDGLVYEAPSQSILKTVQAIEFYMDMNRELRFDLLITAEGVANYPGAAELDLREWLKTYQGRSVDLFRLKVDEDLIPTSFINIISQLRGTGDLLSFLLVDDKLTLWISSPSII